MKWYNFETLFITLRDGLRKFLRDNGIKYELSSCGPGYHFEILTDQAGADMINRWLDENTITEVR